AIRRGAADVAPFLMVPVSARGAYMSSFSAKKLDIMGDCRPCVLLTPKSFCTGRAEKTGAVRRRINYLRGVRTTSDGLNRFRFAFLSTAPRVRDPARGAPTSLSAHRPERARCPDSPAPPS